MNIHSDRPTMRISVINASPSVARSTLKLRSAYRYPNNEPAQGGFDDETMESTMLEFGFMDPLPS